MNTCHQRRSGACHPPSRRPPRGRGEPDSATTGNSNWPATVRLPLFSAGLRGAVPRGPVSAAILPAECVTESARCDFDLYRVRRALRMVPIRVLRGQAADASAATRPSSPHTPAWAMHCLEDSGQEFLRAGVLRIAEDLRGIAGRHKHAAVHEGQSVASSASARFPAASRGRPLTWAGTSIATEQRAPSGRSRPEICRWPRAAKPPRPADVGTTSGPATG